MRASRMRESKGEGEGVKERDQRTRPPCVRMVKWSSLRSYLARTVADTQEITLLT